MVSKLHPGIYNYYWLKTASKQNRDLEAGNQKLREETQKLRDGTQKLRDENDKLRQNNAKLQFDFGAGLNALTISSAETIADISLAMKNCELAEATLEKRLMELAQAKHQVEQLEKYRGDSQDSHKELVELLKKTPKEVADELSKENGPLTKILDLGKATQARWAY